MDLLRSCYEVDMQFDEAADLVTRVQWYFCGDKAHIFPGGHSFGSANWIDPDNVNLGLGERWDSDRPYSKGTAPFCQAVTDNFCGKREWYFDGAPSDANLVQYRGDGTPTCCPPCPCQPFYAASAGHRSVTSSNPVINFTQVLIDDGHQFQVADNSAGSSVDVTDQGLGPCLDSPSATFATGQVNFGPPFNLVVESYDPATFTGTWVVQDGTGPGPPGYTVRIRIPPT